MLSRFLFVDVPVIGTFSESSTPNGTFCEFSQLEIMVISEETRYFR